MPVVKKPETEAQYLRRRLVAAKEVLEEVKSAGVHGHDCALSEHCDLCSCYQGKITRFFKESS